MQSDGVLRLTDGDVRFLTAVGISPPSDAQHDEITGEIEARLVSGDDWLRFTASDGSRWRVHPDDAVEVLSRDPDAVF